MSKLFDALQRAGGPTGLAQPIPVPAARPAPDSGPPIVTVVPGREPQPSRAAQPAPASKIRSLMVRVSDPAVFPFELGAAISEEYRMIRTKLLQNVKRPAIVLVSSPTPGDGKTVTSINIARSLAIKKDANVLLVDGDLVRASIPAKLGLPSAPGLADVLGDSTQLEDALIRVEQLSNLFILPAGDAGSKRTELLDSIRWKTLCETFRREFPITVLDAPPIASIADYDLLQASCDAIVMVVRPDHTNRALCEYCLSLMPKEKFLGVVLNAADPSTLSGRYGAYGYGYAYRANEQEPANTRTQSSKPKGDETSS